NGMNRFFDLAVSFIVAYTIGETLPDVTGDENLLIMDISYALTDMTITDMQFDSFEAAPLAGDVPSIYLDIEGMSISMSFTWDIEDTVWPYTQLTGTGTVTVVLSQAILSATL
ncbi:hypothetical protein KIPB_013027, partial [Kipferlia bialata]